MKFLDAADALIKEFEGCKLTAYKCPVGIWTIGWGCTGGVKEGMTITQEQADQLYIAMRDGVCNRVRPAVSPSLTDAQFSAAVCFAYNVKSWESTPLFRFLKAGNIEKAKEHWTLYDKGDGVEIEGLKRRREAELSLFNQEG